jgi:hypothetical protein
MLVIVLVLVSAAAGALAWLGARAAIRTWWGRGPAAATAVELRAHTGVRRFVDRRLEADVVTGLALTLALAAMVLAGLVVAALAVLVRESDALAHADSAVALWAHRDSDGVDHRLLEDVTTLATTQGVLVIGVVVGVGEWIRVRNRWIPVFLLVVTLGDSIVTNTVKEIVARARPAIDHVAATLGPSFPSGHTSTAAAFFAALALLAGRRRTARTRAALAGVAVGIAVAVACSRVMLDLHWTSDVIAGLALGWGWFAACAIAFGGWLLDFGEPVKAAAGVQEQPGAQPSRLRSGSRWTDSRARQR